MLPAIRKKIRQIPWLSPAREWKARRKMRRLEKSFLRAVVENPPSKVETDNPAPIACGPLVPLRRMLFVSDISWEAAELIPELRRICEVSVLNVHPDLQGYRDDECAPIVEKAVRNHVGKDPDLVFIYGRPGLLGEELFAMVRDRWSCPVLGMNLDDRIQFHPHGIQVAGRDNYGKWAGKFDLNLTSCRVAESWYRGAGANVMFLPQGFCRKDNTSTPPETTDFARRMAFVGSWKQERGRLVNELGRWGINVDLFGSGWPQSRWIDDPVEIFRTTQLNLGIGYIMPSAGVTSLKGRDTECPASGACYLTTYHWEIPELYEIGKEILCYRNCEELVEMYSYYSRKPGECLAIARRAHARGHAEHTWEQRFRKVLRHMGFGFATR